MDGVLAFASLFLGLVSGLQDIGLLVGDEVAAVELRLDGETIGTLRGEPWTVRHDFGSWPEPHRLVAVATDAEGRELARIEQLINLPRPPAEAQVVLFEDADGARLARLVWDTVEAEEPIAVTAAFDDEPLEARDPTRIALPPYDPRIPHVLRAELEFPSGLVATAQATFGGTYLDRVDTRLTAVPIALGGRSRAVGKGDESLVDQLRRAVTLGGKPAPIVAVDKGPVDLVLVRDQSAHEPLRDLLGREARSLQSERRSLTGRSLAQQLQDLFVPSSSTRIQFTWPYEIDAGEEDTNASARPREAETAPARRVFARSGELSSQAGGLLWLLAQMRRPELPAEGQKLADALAIAGRRAASRDRRRAVLLVLGPEPIDRSVFRPEHVAHYLRSIRVPLFVWVIDPETPAARAWGEVAEVADVSIGPRLRRAFRRLDDALEAQRIAWLEGRHLPAEIEIAGEDVGEVVGELAAPRR
jgi:hypothetical protein